MYLILPLILSHFLADYPMQPGKLVEYKFKSVVGVLVHVVIQLMVLLVILFPLLYLDKVFISIIIVFVTHGIIDLTKIYLDTTYPKINKFLLYVADQVLHLSIMMLLAIFYIGKIEVVTTASWVKFYTSFAIADFLLILILVTYFYDITRWAYLNSKKPLRYKRDYKMMARNAIIVVIAFGVYWLIK